ncbi:hypothetical protein EE612_043178 [Oryza sativa]|nr:hypothetical protein EE612_043178 [Oryza sativa]
MLHGGRTLLVSRAALQKPVGDGRRSIVSGNRRRKRAEDRYWATLEETTEDRQRGVLDLEQKPMVGDDRRLISS